MTGDLCTIYVVDDDPSVRRGLDSLLRSAGYAVSCYAATHEVAFGGPDVWPSCIVLDVQMPTGTGLAFQAQMAAAGIPVPIVFLTGHGSVAACVEAMKAGASDFLLKPFRGHELLDTVAKAVEGGRAKRGDDIAFHQLKSRFDTLTVREKQVMSLVVTGCLNKQIASRIGLSEIAIKVNRAQVMRKMAAGSLADLVRMADRLTPPPGRSVGQGTCST